MKNVANCISISRIVASFILFFTDTFSVAFYVIYIYCGMSDMLDGFIARKSKTESSVGAWLDSVSDMVFVIVAMVKILPFLNLANGIIVWMILIAFIKIINVIYGHIHYKRLLLPHTTLNKITGFALFITPFVIVNTESIMFEIIICSVATLAALQEGHLFTDCFIKKAPHR